MPSAATATSEPGVTILQICRVAPPPDTAELSLPLTFFDVTFLKYLPKYRLLFYQLPLLSKSHFLEHIIPNLTKSLSQTLKHFLPISGNLIFPHLNSETMPEIRFQPGDSIGVTIAESSADFKHLIGHQPRDSNDFYTFVPTNMTSASSHRPLFALQVTLFPGAGLSIGFTYHHALGDGSSFARFMQAWSLINANLLRGEGEEGNNKELLAKNDSLPFYDRSLIKDPSGLANQYWKQIKHYVKRLEEEPATTDHHQKYSDNKVRATYVLHNKDIQRLRNFVLAKRPNLATAHLSSFVIASSYIWTCLVKSAVQVGEKVDDMEPEYFDIPVNARTRMEPPLPAGYFGNCLAFALTESTHGELRGDDGFLNGVGVIAEVIREKVNTKGELLKDAGEWQSKYKPVMGKRFFSAVGSPRSDFYDADFGWGKPKKSEVLITDGGGAMSVSRARESEGGLEIGLSLPKNKMDAFAAIFSSLLPKE